MIWLLLACSVELKDDTFKMQGRLGAEPVEEARDLAGFDKVQVASSVDVEVEVVAHGPFSVVVFGEEGSHASVLTSVVDGTLLVDSANGVFLSRRWVEVSVPALSGATVSSAGDLEVEGLHSEAFALASTGSGDTEVKGHATSLQAVLSASGNVDWSGLDGAAVTLVVSGSGAAKLEGEVTTLEAALKGSGDVRVTDLQGPLEAALSGSGSLEVEGTVRSIEATLTGSGELEADGVDATGVELVSSGSGDVRLDGQAEHLEAVTKGSGGVEACALRVAKAEVVGAGSGAIELHVLEQVTGAITGTGVLELCQATEAVVEVVGKVRRR